MNTPDRSADGAEVRREPSLAESLDGRDKPGHDGLRNRATSPRARKVDCA
jgi:hypothetical protein